MGTAKRQDEADKQLGLKSSACKHTLKPLVGFLQDVPLHSGSKNRFRDAAEQLGVLDDSSGPHLGGDTTPSTVSTNTPGSRVLLTDEASSRSG